MFINRGFLLLREREKMVKTHPNFKSIISTVSDAETIEKYLWYPLSYQNTFQKKTTPHERKLLWNENELESFKIVTEEIDRLYYINYDEDGIWGRDYHLVARIGNYKGRQLYVELVAGCDYSGFCHYGLNGWGTIYVSSNPSLFMKIIIFKEMDPKLIIKNLLYQRLRPRYDKTLIYQSLREDGFYVEEMDIYSKIFRMKNAPMLKHLCYENIYTHFEVLQSSLSTLPHLLKINVKDFKQYQDAIKDYNKIVF